MRKGECFRERHVKSVSGAEDLRPARNLFTHKLTFNRTDYKFKKKLNADIRLKSKFSVAPMQARSFLVVLKVLRNNTEGRRNVTGPRAPWGQAHGVEPRWRKKKRLIDKNASDNKTRPDGLAPW